MNNSMEKDVQITNYPHRTAVKLAWGEMDALGHVNNIIYFRYMETARIDYFESLGINLPTISSDFGPILAHIECQFLSAVSYPDDLIIGSHIYHFGTTSLKMEHGIYSSKQDRVVARGDSVIVMIDYQTMTKVPVPEELKQVITDYQASAKSDFQGK